MKIGVGSIYAMLLSICEFCDNQSIERHTLLRDANENLPHFLHFSLDLDTILCGGVHKNLLDNCELHENQFSESYTLLKGINEFLSSFSTLTV